MHRFSLFISFLLLSLPAFAQQPAAPPHAWLFGAWTGGLFPAPVTLSAEECLAQPTVIFTRDSVFRVSVTDPAYVQRQIETARATATGAVFRFITAPQPPRAGGGMFDLLQQSAPQNPPFGCADPNALVVQRRSANEIAFQNCPAMPYPLVRCPSR